MMITREHDGHLLIVTQPHHAELAGQLAAHWGNDEFQELEPVIAMIRAANEHDNGWREWDNRPTIDPSLGLPYSFATLTYVEHTKLYWQGIILAAEEDPYEGMIVCMHGRGLYNQRYQTDLAMKRVPQGTKEKIAVNKLVRASELLQKKLRRRLAGSKYRRQASERQIWANYCLLQAFDRISLHVCWKGLVPYSVQHVPTGYGKGEEVTLNLEPMSDGAIRLSPYPFTKRPFEALATGCLVPLQKYETDEQFRENYYKGQRVELKFKFI
jgi:hypothetical protein